MGNATTGKVIVSARVENSFDLYEVEQGRLAADQVRAIDIDDALVDTGATLLSLPTRYIRQLGLKQVRERTTWTDGSVIRLRIYSVVRLMVQGRDVTTEVCEIPDDCPASIGRVPLLGLDFVVDVVAQRLIGNPDHGGEQMIEVWMTGIAREWADELNDPREDVYTLADGEPVGRFC